jgi:phage terminase large subunit-like protein
MFGIIVTLDEGDDKFDPVNWGKANPMLGITPSIRYMESKATDAKADPASEGNFETKNLNVWRNAASAWLNMVQWNRCEDTKLDWKDFAGLDCYVGADLSDKDDITALVLVAFDKNGTLITKAIFYLPEQQIKNTKASDNAVLPYRIWEREGWLTLTDGDWIDMKVVHKEIEAWIEEYSISMVTFDQFSAGQNMVADLNEDFASPDEPVAQILHKSAAKATDPAKGLEARVKAGMPKFRHDGKPIQTWMASNVVVTRKVDGSIIPKKETPNSDMKIDGIDGLINAIQPAQYNGEHNTS